MSQTKETIGKAETFRVTGKNYDAVIRQVADKYHSGNGWSVVRTIDRIITMDVYVERNSEQGVGSEQALEVEQNVRTGSVKDSTETPTEVSDKVSDTLDTDKVSDTDKVDTKTTAVRETPTTRKTPATKVVKATKEIEK